MANRSSGSARHFQSNTSGSVAMITVLASGLMFGMAALTVDASRLYLAKRQQQAVTDLAAVAAAANLANAQAAATANLVANNVPVGSLGAVELGTYVPDPAVAAGQRFTLGGALPNAARVTLKSAPATVFGRMLGVASATVGTRSIAVNANTTAFAIGSTLVGVNGGLANALLGSLTGSSLSLTADDYAGLASANVDLFGLADALALRINAAGTYAALGATTVRLSDFVNALATAAASSGGSATAVAALSNMASAIGISGPSLTLGSLLSFGPYGNLAPGSPAPVSASLPVLPLITAAARLGGGTFTVSTGLNLAGTAITNAHLTLVLAHSGGGPSFAAVGTVGTTLHTAQARLLLSLQLAPSGTIASLNLPLALDIAPASATLSAVGCSAGAPVDPAATLSVAPGVVDSWIGNVSNGALSDLSTPLDPGYATLTSLPLSLVTISGRANASVSNLNASSIPFTQADIAAGTMKTTATTDYTSSLLSSLIGNLQLNAALAGINIPLPSGAAAAVATLLQNALHPIDQALSSTLGMLGITIGDANTWVRGQRCGQGVLVN